LINTPPQSSSGDLEKRPAHERFDSLTFQATQGKMGYVIDVLL
jgi:hypothetical protein